ncbi:MAG: Rpn family recombination-promoting nuclease/putative transposase [Selenomonadaceae bacterium]|nr:Rpn family recombination-promoting nuclease/putative transposase [Selenomonadaceae bacterium]
MTEKQLFELEDVFADIVNVLLLNGKSLILPEELTPAKKDSLYKDKELKTHMQERDVAKLWTQGNVRMAFFGLEDQTVIDYDMALRIIGYDGAVYRAMLLERDNASDKFPLYPAITMVLHFDYEHRWTGARTLKECFKNIPPELDPYVSDYKINVFEIAWLPDETIAKFKSDFWYVADYYSQMRKTGKWQPIPGKAKHIKELLELLGAVTNDNRFIEMYQKSKGKVSDMSCVALDYLKADLKEEIGNQMRNEGRDLERLNSIRNLMTTSKWSVQQAMEALLIPKEDQQRYADRL